MKTTTRLLAIVAALALLGVSRPATAEIEIYNLASGPDLRGSRVVMWTVEWDPGKKTTVINVWLQKNKREYRLRFTEEHFQVGLMVARDIGKKLNVWTATAKRPFKISRDMKRGRAQER